MKLLYFVALIWVALGIALIALLALPSGVQAAQRCEPDLQLVSMGQEPKQARPGEVLRVTFQLQDKNDCGIADGLQLVFADGQRLSGPTQRNLGALKPGQSLELVFDVQAPKQAGDYLGVWQLKLGRQVIGPQLVVNLRVAEPIEDKNPAPDLPVGVLAPQTTLEYGEFVTVPAGSLANTHVLCSDGLVTGGGWTLTGAYLDPRVYRSRLYGNGWSVSALNDSDTDVELRAYAVCLHNVVGYTYEVTQPVEVPSGEFTYDVVDCPADAVRTGGGFDVYAYNDMEIQVSTPEWEGDGWHMRVNNNSFVSETAINAIICLHGPEPDTGMQHGEPFAVGYVEDQVFPGHGVASCPAGSIATSGGFGYASFTYFESILTENNTWEVLAQNHQPTPAGQTPPFMYASVTCLDF